MMVNIAFYTESGKLIDVSYIYIYKCGFYYLYKSHFRQKDFAYSLQGHSSGTHLFIFALKIWRVSESFISLGKISHIFGAKDGIDLVPYFTDLTLLFSKKFP